MAQEGKAIIIGVCQSMQQNQQEIENIFLKYIKHRKHKICNTKDI